MVQRQKLLGSKLHNIILLCVTETNKFTIVSQFYNTTGCSLQKNTHKHTFF